MTDQELKDLVANLAIETAKLKESQNQTDEQMKKTDEKLKELGILTIQRQNQTDEQMKKTDEQMKKTDEQMKKTDEKLKRMGIHLGNISNNQGDVAEEYFINSLQNDPKIGDIAFDIVDSKTLRMSGNLKDEFDIILINGESVAVIEVKYKVHPNDVKKLSKKLENFKALFPVYRSYKIYMGVAGFSIPQDSFDLAKQHGYFILQRKGDVIESFTDGLKAA
jgi:hypothetical protein